MININNNLIIRQWGILPYAKTYKSMQDFTQNRINNINIADELWLLQHYPVFTVGLKGQHDPIDFNKIKNKNIAVINTNRGGRMTYHGPGQLIAYCLIDLAKLKISHLDFIKFLEDITIKTIKIFVKNQYKNKISIINNKPGVYIDNQKIAAIGLRIKKNFTLHGLSLNIDLDLTPFDYIHPCGEPERKITQLSDWCDDQININILDVYRQFSEIFYKYYNNLFIF